MLGLQRRSSGSWLRGRLRNFDVDIVNAPRHRRGRHLASRILRGHWLVRHLRNVRIGGDVVLHSWIRLSDTLMRARELGRDMWLARELRLQAGMMLMLYRRVVEHPAWNRMRRLLMVQLLVLLRLLVLMLAVGLLTGAVPWQPGSDRLWRIWITVVAGRYLIGNSALIGRPILNVHRLKCRRHLLKLCGCRLRICGLTMRRLYLRRVRLRLCRLKLLHRLGGNLCSRIWHRGPTPGMV